MLSFSQRSNPTPLNWIVEQARDVAELVVRLNKLTKDDLEIHFVFAMPTDAFCHRSGAAHG
jgi:hypothetical protein